MMPSMTMRGWAVVFVAFLTLHQPNGRPVYIAIEQIDGMAPADQSSHPGAGTRMLVYGAWITVRETPTEIQRLLGSRVHRRPQDRIMHAHH